MGGQVQPRNLEKNSNKHDSWNSPPHGSRPGQGLPTPCSLLWPLQPPPLPPCPTGWQTLVIARPPGRGSDLCPVHQRGWPGPVRVQRAEGTGGEQKPRTVGCCHGPGGLSWLPCLPQLGRPVLHPEEKAPGHQQRRVGCGAYGQTLRFLGGGQLPGSALPGGLPGTGLPEAGARPLGARGGSCTGLRPGWRQWQGPHGEPGPHDPPDSSPTQQRPRRAPSPALPRRGRGPGDACPQ